VEAGGVLGRWMGGYQPCHPSRKLTARRDAPPKSETQRRKGGARGARKENI